MYVLCGRCQANEGEFRQVFPGTEGRLPSLMAPRISRLHSPSALPPQPALLGCGHAHTQGSVRPFQRLALEQRPGRPSRISSPCSPAASSYHPRTTPPPPQAAPVRSQVAKTTVYFVVSCSASGAFNACRGNCMTFSPAGSPSSGHHISDPIFLSLHIQNPLPTQHPGKPGPEPHLPGPRCLPHGSLKPQTLLVSCQGVNTFCHVSAHSRVQGLGHGCHGGQALFSPPHTDSASPRA